MPALLPMDEIERWRAEARAISHDDNLGHLVVNLLELMQSVLVGGLHSQTLHLKIRAVLVECEKVMGVDPKRGDRERTFLYGVTQSICALLRSLAGEGGEGTEKAALQTALVPYVEKSQEEHAEKAVVSWEADSLVHDTTLTDDSAMEEDVDVGSPFDDLEQLTPEQFKQKFAEIMNRKADDSGMADELDETHESEDQQSFVGADNSPGEANALAMVPFQTVDEDSGSKLPRKRARSSYFKKMEEAEEERKREKNEAIEKLNVVGKREDLMGEAANPLQCRECGAVSRCLAEVKAHMRTHTGERPYACSECANTYKESFHLKTHLRKVHAVNPYSCHCGESFATRTEMVAHRDSDHKIERGVFQCDKCERSYMYNHALNLHLREKHGAMPYPCEHCGEGFPFRNDLVYHRMKVHGK